MFQVSLDQPGLVVTVRHSQQVSPEEMRRCLGAVRELMAAVQPGFQLLTDLTHLEFMDLGCAPYIAEIMDLLSEHGIKGVVRVIPNPHKDIGYTLLSYIHYDQSVETITVETLAAARQLLSA